jgi:hypothetical protein
VNNTTQCIHKWQPSQPCYIVGLEAQCGYG